MARAFFEIECSRPDVVLESVRIDDAHAVKFEALPGKLTMEIEAESLKALMKISYSVCNRVQLSIDTIDKFGPQSNS